MRWLIDPPGPFASLEEWTLYLAELRALPQDEPDRDELIAQAEATIARLKRAFRPTRGPR
jgi:hypothetical protein